MTDIEGKRVLDIVQDRKAESIDKLFNTLAEYQSNGIEAVSMDFWKPFITGANKHIPHAAIIMINST